MNMTTFKTKTMSPAKDTEALLRPITSPESMKIQNSTQSDPDCRMNYRLMAFNSTCSFR